MDRRYRELHDIADAAVERHPGVSYEISRGKHYKITFTFRGQSSRVVTPISPSDRRNQKNIAAYIRRAVSGLVSEQYSPQMVN